MAIIDVATRPINERVYATNIQPSPTRSLNGWVQREKWGVLGFFFQKEIYWDFNFNIGALWTKSPKKKYIKQEGTITIIFWLSFYYLIQFMHSFDPKACHMDYCEKSSPNVSMLSIDVTFLLLNDVDIFNLILNHSSFTRKCS